MQNKIIKEWVQLKKKICDKKNTNGSQTNSYRFPEEKSRPSTTTRSFYFNIIKQARQDAFQNNPQVSDDRHHFTRTGKHESSLTHDLGKTVLMGTAI